MPAHAEPDDARLTALLSDLRARLGEAAVQTDDAALGPHLAEARGLYRGRAAALLRPADTGEVAFAVEACARAGPEPLSGRLRLGVIPTAMPRASTC